MTHPRRVSWALWAVVVGVGAGLLLIQRAGAQDDTRAAGTVEEKLDLVLVRQAQILTRLDAIEKELGIVKVRCTR